MGPALIERQHAASLQALTALLSGEMRDTAELGTLTKHATENYLPRPSRAHMFRRCFSLSILLAFYMNVLPLNGPAIRDTRMLAT